MWGERGRGERGSWRDVSSPISSMERMDREARKERMERLKRLGGGSVRLEGSREGNSTWKDRALEPVPPAVREKRG